MLEVSEAIRHVRGKDRRPLLILRDCEGCANREGDLVKLTLLDERFLLGSDWFQCVRVGHDVLKEEHPLHKLFEGDRPHHVLVSTWDGAYVLPVQRAGRKEIWNAMTRVLRQNHEKSPERAMKGLIKLLSEFDSLDDRETALKAQLETKMERGKLRRVEQLQRELAELREEREEAFERERELRNLERKPDPEAAEGETRSG